MTTRKIRCICKRVLFHVVDSRIEIMCPCTKCKRISVLDLSPSIQPSSEHRPHRAVGSGEVGNEPRERGQRQEGPKPETTNAANHQRIR